MDLFCWDYKKQLLRSMLSQSGTLEEIPVEKDAVGLLTSMRTGVLSSVDIISRSLCLMLQKEETLNAMISINPKALEEARRCDQLREGGDRRPLLGLPVVIKDNINTKDLPTTFGSYPLRNTQPKKDAAIVSALREAGAIILGKSSLSEFASDGMCNNSLIGQTRNPYDYTRTPGGSSGGSGVAVAVGYAVAGIGTDGVNSIRSPGSANGIIGLRPTKGLLDREGIGISSTWQDMPGILTRSSRDAKLFLDVLADEKEKLLSDGDGLKGKRIALLKKNCGENPQVLAVLSAVVEVFRACGATVLELDDPVLDVERMLRENNVIRYEQRENSDRYFSDPQNGTEISSFDMYLATGAIEKSVLSVLRLELDEEYSSKSPAYFRRMKRNQADQKYVLELMEKEKIDAFCYPSQTIPVVKIGDSRGQAGRNGIMASCLGLPAVTFPGGFTTPEECAPVGLPVGIEWMGKPFSDSVLLEMVSEFEGYRGSGRSLNVSVK